MADTTQAAKLDEFISINKDNLSPEQETELRSIIQRLRTSPEGQEMLPPNIPQGDGAAKHLHRWLLQQAEGAKDAGDEDGARRFLMLAEGTPKGHPGIDYEDLPEQPVTNQAGPQTSRGKPIPFGVPE